jgi:carbamoyltransferase
MCWTGCNCQRAGGVGLPAATSACTGGGESGAVDARQQIAMGRFFTDRPVAALGPLRAREAPLTQREMDIARSTRRRFEGAAVHWLRRLHRIVPTERLAMAGGCALNRVANARILRDTPFTTRSISGAWSARE